MADWREAEAHTHPQAGGPPCTASQLTHPARVQWRHPCVWVSVTLLGEQKPIAGGQCEHGSCYLGVTVPCSLTLDLQGRRGGGNEETAATHLLGFMG